MSKVYLASPNPLALAGDWWTDLERLRASALKSQPACHGLVDFPELADVILFSDAQTIDQSDIRDHELTRRFPDRIFVYSALDKVVPHFPGVYTSAERGWFISTRMKAGVYVKVISHNWIEYSETNAAERPYLFSFLGSFDTHPVRRKLAELRTARGLIRDTSQDEGRGFGKSTATYQDWQKAYFESIRDCAFVLCPRGVCPSSYRIFEAMRAGRVPVIVADAWIPPIGPEWSDFSIRVPECAISELPQILEKIEPRAGEMGRRARLEWERWFSDLTIFQTIVEWCLELQGKGNISRSLSSALPYLHYARPFFFRHAILARAKRMIIR